MLSYQQDTYYQDTYHYGPYHDSYYQIPYPPSTTSYSDKPLIKTEKKARTLSKPPIRTKVGPDPTKAIQKLENGVRKVCRKVSEATIEVCTKIYKKSRSAISTAVEKRRSIKCEKSTVAFTSEERRHLKISDPKSPAMYYF